MSTALWAIGILLGIGGAVVGVVEYWRRSVTNEVTADEQAAALQLEAERVAQQERAAEAERARRRELMDAKAAAVTDVAGADQLLRDATSGKS